MTSTPSATALPSTSKSGAPAKRRRGEGRGEILRTARELFVERGYGNASTKEIAARAGYVENMIFRHFGTKANLFAEAVIEPFRSFFDGFFAELSQRPLDEITGDEIFREDIGRLYDVICENRSVLLAVMTADSFESESLGDAMEGFSFSDAFDELGKMTVVAQEALGLRDCNLDVINRAIFGMVLGVALTGKWTM